MSKNIKIEIKLYNPETEQISWREFSVPTSAANTILDALDYIKNNGYPSLAYRSSCRMGLCGSCAAIVNGKHVLMCHTFCRDQKQPIKIEPLKNFPIIKDLITDTDDVMNKFRSVMPYTEIQKRHLSKIGETVQTTKQRKKIEQSSQCIKCLLCYSACPVFGHNKEFIGPAAATLAYRYSADSHDKIGSKRIESITGDEGIYKCTFVGECSKVCPKNVDPASTLQRLKVMGVLNSFKKIIE